MNINNGDRNGPHIKSKWAVFDIGRAST